MRLIFSLLILLLPTWAISQAIAQTSNSLTTGTVILVEDGDTIQVNQNGRIIPVRLACISAPEMNQPQGVQSANRLRQLLPRNTVVQLRTASISPYNRLVAEVYRNGVSVNLQMVQEGRAIADRRLLYGCLATRDRYLQVEQSARQRRLAFWSLTNPTITVSGRLDSAPITIPPYYRTCDPAADSTCPESGLREFEVVRCAPEWDRECLDSGMRAIEITNPRP